jgi:hypothetical protein
MDIDTDTGGEGLSIDEAVAAYTKATAPEAAPSQAETEDDELSDTTTDDELQEPDEGEGDEGDGETDDEGQADDEQDVEEPETEKGRYVAHNGRVKLPDGSESTIADLIQGNLRDRDYRQKTMAHAEAVKTFTSQSEAVTQKEKQIAEQATYVADLIRTIVPTAPDPEMLKTDPMGYIAQEASHKQWVAHLTYLDQQRQQATEASQAETSKVTQERAQQEWATLLEKVPALKDQKRAAAWFGDIETYAKSEGYTVEELQAAIRQDHRQAVTLRKAALWDKLQASKTNVPKKIEGRPPVQRGGKRLNSTERSSRTANEAFTRLKSSGSVEDAAAAYLASRKG